MNAEHIQRTAADWLAKRIGDDWTQQDEAEFDIWIDANITHRIQYVRIEAAWRQTARLKALGAGVPPGAIPPRNSWGDMRYYRGNIDLESEPTGEVVHESGSTQGTALAYVSELPGEPPTIRTPKRFRALALAASALLCVLASGYVLFNYFGVNYFGANHYATPIGATDTVPLQDGSHITLNTDTSIQVDLGSTERHIELKKGEAYFEVAKDPQRPFIVQAGHKRVIAVGTKFSVRRDHDDVQVAVTEGKVRLEEVPGSSPESGYGLRERRAAQGRSGGPVLLTAGAVARTADAQVIVDQNTIADADRLLAWRRGYITFDNTPLAEAVPELNRYNMRKLIIQDPAVADIRIGGSFRATNTDAFLELLHSGHSIVVEHEEDNVILKAR
jgi:transmembrane sensor